MVHCSSALCLLEMSLTYCYQLRKVRKENDCHEFICQLVLLDRSLMIGWRKKIMKPWKGVLCIHFRVRVCLRATEHTLWPRNLIFGLNDEWDMRKKRIFFFKIFIFTLLIGIFLFFPNTTLVFFLFQATGHSFSHMNVIIGLREHCTIENWRLLIFLFFYSIFGTFSILFGKFSLYIFMLFIPAIML